MERIKDKGENIQMNENLSQLVQDSDTTEGVVFSETDLDLPEEELSEDVATDIIEEPQADVIPIAMLSPWFEANSEGIDNINQVKVVIRGINSNSTLIMAVKNNEGIVDDDGNDERDLRVFDNADSIPVLDLPPLSMDIYNNGFKIVYQHGDVFIKTYGVRTGLICSLCASVGAYIIPYSIIRVKKKDTELELPATPPIITYEKLAEPADLESLQLLYKQSAKSIDDLSTNQSVINWLIDRQRDVTDINHHLQIDNVLIDILK
jgi:hypothetical protein